MEDPSHGRMGELVTIPELPEEDEYETDTACNCEDCKQQPATCRFLHLDGREFFLCYTCFYSADHESDYGKDFEDQDHEDIDYSKSELYDLGYDECYDTDSDDEWFSQ